MSTRKWVDKKKATKFALVHRSHEDPLYYDDEATEHVLMPISNPNDKRKQDAHIRLERKEDLIQKLKNEKMRENEGEAALYGVTYDDSKYDYMQHLKPIGKDQGGIFIEKKNSEPLKNKNKDIFKDLQEILPSEQKLKLDYQDQQDVPDTIKGFKPDMDPRLREVLEALEDDAYLDEDQDVEEGDIFDDLLQGGELEDGEDFDEDYDEYDYELYDDEYESGKEETWEDDFKKFHRSQKHVVNEWDSDDEFDDEEEEEQDELPELPDIQPTSKKAKQKLRRKKGALTDTSSYSMSSSALFRTEGLRLLDDRYEQLLKKQQQEDDEEEEEYQPFDMSRERPDFESMLDDFLDNYEVEGKRRIVKKNAEKDKIKLAALSASKGKMVDKLKREQGMTEVEKTLKNLRL